MNVKILLFGLVFLSVIFISPTFAGNNPEWVKNTAGGLDFAI